jgi:DtxR family Mn-dependent transcriptional regulator
MEKDWREGLEDLLEAIWLRREAGQEFQPARYRVRVCRRSTEELLDGLVGAGLVALRNGNVDLTSAGETAAARIVRRHRLAERLFHDLLRTDVEETASFACRFEHILNEEVTEAVCTLLGHPPTCPHGNRIPPGPCCRRSQREVKPLVQPLTELPPGSRARIVFIAPSVHRRLDRLNALGILPGEVVQVHQKRPAFVLRVGATELAIEKDIAAEIYGIRLEP